MNYKVTNELNSKKAKALQLFNGGFSCSQAVLGVFADDLGLSEEDALKISTAFGGGIAGTGETCGVVSGALMALGLKYGRSRLEDTDAKEKTSASAKEFLAEFQKKNGKLKCNDLLECDITAQAGKEIAAAKRALPTHCQKFVADAVEIVNDLVHP